MTDILSTLRIAKAFLAARRNSFDSRAQLESWQDRQVRKHLQYVVANSGYYRKLFAGLDFHDWRQFPITTKQNMMESFDEFNTIGVSGEEAFAIAKRAESARDFQPTLNGATVGLSSGTSGNHSLFLSQPRENDAFIGTALARLMRGSPLAKHRIAFFHRAHSNLYNGMSSGRMQHEFFDLSIDFLQHLSRLSDLKPTTIIGPPFALRQIGMAKRNGQIDIAPGGLLAVAEVLEATDKRQIEMDLGVRLDQAYIATEGFIAATCPHGSIHVNEDILVMQREWIDTDQRRFIPILTDFRRKTQPIVRYRLNDILVDSTHQCPCGSVFTALETIEGRCDDVLVVESIDGRSNKHVFPDFVRQALCLDSARKLDYRVVQSSLGQITVQLDVSTEHFDAEQTITQQALERLFDQLGCQRPKLRFEMLVETDRRGKTRRVAREFPIDLVSN